MLDLVAGRAEGELGAGEVLGELGEEVACFFLVLSDVARWRLLHRRTRARSDLRLHVSLFGVFELHPVAGFIEGTPLGFRLCLVHTLAKFYCKIKCRRH